MNSKTEQDLNDTSRYTQLLVEDEARNVSLQLEEIQNPIASEKPIPELSLDEVVETIGVGKFQLCIMFMCGASLSADAMEILLITFVHRKVIIDLQIDSVQMSSLTSMIFLGMLIGAVAIGNLADHIGRRTAFSFALLLNSIFGVASAFSPSFKALMAFRFFVGIGCGGLHIAYTLFLELLPSKQRGRYHVFLTVFWVFGIIIESILVVALQKYSWRVLVGASAVPCILVLITYIFAPESPRFLLVKNKMPELNKLMHRIARFNGVLDARFPNGFTIKPIVTDELVESDTPRESLLDQLKGLFGPSVRSLTLTLWGIWFIIAEVYFGVVLLAPSIRLSENEVFDLCLVSLGDVPAFFVTYLSASSNRSVYSIMVGSIVVGLSTLVLALDHVPRELHFIALFMARFAICTTFNTMWFYTPGAYPTKYRSTGLGFCAAISRIASSITPLIATGLGESNRALAAMIYAVSAMICAIACRSLPREKSTLIDN